LLCDALARTDHEPKIDNPYMSQYPSSQLWQLGTLLQRGRIKLLRDHKATIVTLSRSSLVALFMGSLFWQQIDCGYAVQGGSVIGNSTQTFSSDCFDEKAKAATVMSLGSQACTDCGEAVFNRFSMMFFSLLFIMMSNLQAISGLCTDRALFYRERSSGLYTTWAYFLATILSYLPVIFLSTVLFSVIIYSMVGFHATVEASLYFLTMMFLVNIIGYCYAQLLAAVTPSVDITLAIFPMTFVFFNTFAGYLIHVPEVPAGWIWATDVSFIRWAIQGLVINEFKDRAELRYYNGRDVLELYGYDNTSKWTSMWVLCVIVIVVNIGTYLCLEYVRYGST